MRGSIKIITIIILMTTFIVGGFSLVGSKIRTLSDARRVKVGMVSDSLTSIMGKPFQIEINSEGEYWHFKYTKSVTANINVMRVKVVNDTVRDFYSY